MLTGRSSGALGIIDAEHGKGGGAGGGQGRGARKAQDEVSADDVVLSREQFHQIFGAQISLFIHRRARLALEISEAGVEGDTRSVATLVFKRLALFHHWGRPNDGPAPQQQQAPASAAPQGHESPRASGHGEMAPSPRASGGGQGGGEARVPAPDLEPFQTEAAAMDLVAALT
jgi:hypothetical protein